MKFFDIYIAIFGRVMLAQIFVISGISKINSFDATQGYMHAFGLSGVLLVPTIAFEIGAGLLIVAGLMTRPTALALALFSLLTAVIFHANFADQIQSIMFLKNVSMAGGLLLLARYGAGTLSIDYRFFTKDKKI